MVWWVFATLRVVLTGVLSIAASIYMQPAPAHSAFQNVWGPVVIALAWTTVGASASLAWSREHDRRTLTAIGVLSMVTLVAWASYFFVSSSFPIVGVIAIGAVAVGMIMGFIDDWKSRDQSKPARG